MSPNYHKSLNISMTCAFYCCFHKKVFLNIVTSLSPSVIFSMIMEAAIITRLYYHYPCAIVGSVF